MTGKIDIVERLTHHCIDQTTTDTLRDNQAVIHDLLPDVLEEFYRHYALIASASKHFTDAAKVEQAKQRQLAHWKLALSGVFDARYVQSATTNGETHYRLGLDIGLYIGAYSFLATGLQAAIAERFPAGLFNRGADRRRSALQRAVMQAAMLDMDFVIGVYLEAAQSERDGTLRGLARDLDATVGTIANTLSGSVGQMDAAARELAMTAEEASMQTRAVAAATDQTSASINAVASATEELVASVNEIHRQVAGSAEVTGQAMAAADDTVEKVHRLSAAAGKIGAIVDLISDIADQTNLLALNATIEAARAGAAGRGFAVVAHEVKALADQTARATDEITAQIADIQDATGESARAIDLIADFIRRLNDIGASISGAVAQQSASVGEITTSLQQVSRGAIEVSANVNGISQSATQTGASAAQTGAAAAALASEVAHLKDEVARFFARIASA